MERTAPNYDRYISYCRQRKKGSLGVDSDYEFLDEPWTEVDAPRQHNKNMIQQSNAL